MFLNLMTVVARLSIIHMRPGLFQMKLLHMHMYMSSLSPTLTSPYLHYCVHTLDLFIDVFQTARCIDSGIVRHIWIPASLSQTKNVSRPY